MTTVLAGGDSFVWGSELADSPHGGSSGFSKKTFPALLAKHYMCAAYPGIGNKEIGLRVKQMLNYSKPDIVIVCWTWPSRDNDVTSDNCIQDLEEYLKSHKTPYIFTCADNCIVTGNLNYENWFFFPPGHGPDQTNQPRGFYQWAVENKYSCGKQNHPLEQAHWDAAKLIQGKFNELVTKSLL
jgi:hypothetical protein